jgi:hypothetical protein
LASHESGLIGSNKKPHRTAIAGGGAGTEKRPSPHHNHPVSPCRGFGHGLSALPSTGKTWHYEFCNARSRRSAEPATSAPSLFLYYWRFGRAVVPLYW